MKTAYLLGVVIVSGMLAAAPAMAENDFHALSQLSTEPSTMAEDQLASTEGGIVLPSITVYTPVTFNVAVLTQNNVCGAWCSGGQINIGGIGQQ